MTKELGYGAFTTKCYCGNDKGINQLVCDRCHKKK